MDNRPHYDNLELFLDAFFGPAKKELDNIYKILGWCIVNNLPHDKKILVRIFSEITGWPEDKSESLYDKVVLKEKDRITPSSKKS